MTFQISIWRFKLVYDVSIFIFNNKFILVHITFSLTFKLNMKFTVWIWSIFFSTGDQAYAVQSQMLNNTIDTAEYTDAFEYQQQLQRQQQFGRGFWTILSFKFSAKFNNNFDYEKQAGTCSVVRPEYPSHKAQLIFQPTTSTTVAFRITPVFKRLKGHPSRRGATLGNNNLATLETFTTADILRTVLDRCHLIVVILTTKIATSNEYLADLTC